MPEVAVDAAAWASRRGFGRHLRGILPPLIRLDPERRYTLVLDSAAPADALPAGAAVHRVPTTRPTAAAAAASGHRSTVDLLRMSRALADPRYDLVLFPTVWSYVPVRSRARKLVLIHDLIPETYPALTLPRLPARLLWRAKTALARRQADVVLTVSDYSRDRLRARYRIPPARLFVVGVAPDPVFRVVPDARPSPRLADLGLVGDRPLVVYVGGFGPHKNVGALLSAFADLPPRAGDARLVLVGDPAETFHSAYPALVAEVARRGLGARACFTGFLPDPDLAILLNLARVLVLPSLLEGLGLPAVEAAACGCPVIATARSPLPALLGGGGLYVDPERPAEIGEALVLVLGSAERRQAMRQAGLAAAAALTWDGAARQLMAALDAALRLP